MASRVLVATRRSSPRIKAEREGYPLLIDPEAGGIQPAVADRSGRARPAFLWVGIFATVLPEVPMAKVEKISVALPPEMVGAVRDAVVSGEYASTSEVIRDALRDWSLKRKVATVELDEMRRLVREGIESGQGIDADLVFARLRAKYAGMTEK